MFGRRSAAILLCVAAAAVLTGCGGDDTSDADLSSADPTRTPLTGVTSEQLSGYSSSEKSAYQEAVAAVQRNLRVGLRVYREGEATPAARRALESIYAGQELEDEWETLRAMEADGGYLDGSAEVVWTRPTRILVSGSEGTVNLLACVDRRDIRAYERDQGEIAQPVTSERAVFELTVDLGDGGIWRVSDGEETDSC
ncbi:MAG TPA: hypothetical protein VEX15_10230 [Nocardioidaceae bacterium]|nr:hypothetical protein [Nocardioidaceae bacterium]